MTRKNYEWYIKDMGDLLKTYADREVKTVEEKITLAEDIGIVKGQIVGALICYGANPHVQANAITRVLYLKQEDIQLIDREDFKQRMVQLCTTGDWEVKKKEVLNVKVIEAAHIKTGEEDVIQVSTYK